MFTHQKYQSIIFLVWGAVTLLSKYFNLDIDKTIFDAFATGTAGVLSAFGYMKNKDQKKSFSLSEGVKPEKMNVPNTKYLAVRRKIFK